MSQSDLTNNIITEPAPGPPQHLLGPPQYFVQMERLERLMSFNTGQYEREMMYVVYDHVIYHC